MIESIKEIEPGILILGAMVFLATLWIIKEGIIAIIKELKK